MSRAARLLAEAPDWLSYDLPGDVTKKTWKGRFRGQTQKWFALQFTGEEAEIDIATPDGGRTRPSSTPGAGSGSSGCRS